MQRPPQLIAPQFGTGHQLAGREEPPEPFPWTSPKHHWTWSPPRADPGRTQHLHLCCGLQQGAGQRNVFAGLQHSRDTKFGWPPWSTPREAQLGLRNTFILGLC